MEAPAQRDRSPAGWRAELALGFEPRPGRTLLARRRHRGPLTVQRPFYPEGEVCHVYLLHPPGGVVGGDHLAIDIHLAPGSNALVTTPGAAKFYRSAGPRARQSQRLRVEAGAALEWFPQENILFSGAHADLDTRIELAPEARFLGWDITCLGRPVVGERFDAGDGVLGLSLDSCGIPVLLDRLQVHGQADLDRPAGLRGFPVNGTFIATGAGPEHLERARALALVPKDGLAGVTLMDGILVARYLGHDAEAAKHLFVNIWQALRPGLLGRTACPPRIWAT